MRSHARGQLCEHIHSLLKSLVFKVMCQLFSKLGLPIVEMFVHDMCPVGCGPMVRKFKSTLDHSLDQWVFFSPYAWENLGPFHQFYPFFWQLCANISGWILAKLPVAEEPQDLVSALNSGFFKVAGMRPHEPVKAAFKLDHVRDWKGWLERGGKRVSGIFGPSAPHWFEFVRRDSH